MALEFGMTANEFWYGDPNLFNSYRTSFINKKKRESEEKNYEAWLFGLYQHHGLNVSLSNMFKKKGSTPQNYMSKPINFEKEKNKNTDLKQKYLNNLRYFATKQNYNRK